MTRPKYPKSQSLSFRGRVWLGYLASLILWITFVVCWVIEGGN
jgi:hypothetical protein